MRGGHTLFARAFSLASTFTRPVIISTRLSDGTVRCVNGAFVILNDHGWVATAAHLLEPLAAAHRHPDRITNHSSWWGADGVSLQDIRALPEADLVAGRLEPFAPGAVAAYPLIKDPGRGLQPGTSLCKLGYPFHDLKASFDESRGAFALAPGVVPLPLFPLEGIYTRSTTPTTSAGGKHPVRFLETSSPGLRGQSGGPIVDTRGTVWAIQSRTAHFPLGFSPRIARNGVEVEENQFLNVGLGVHPEAIVAFLEDNGIPFRLSDY